MKMMSTNQVVGMQQFSCILLFQDRQFSAFSRHTTKDNVLKIREELTENDLCLK